MDNDCRERLTLLTVRAQAGDRDALARLLEQVQSELFSYLVRYTARRDVAEDALQDTFLIICRQLRWLREPRFFRTWAYRIATREAWRRLRTLREHEPLPADTSRPAEPQPDAGEQRLLLERIESLPPNCRAVVLLHYWSGLSLNAAAAALDVPVGTVKSRLAYALQLLRKESTHGPQHQSARLLGEGREVRDPRVRRG